MSRLGEILVGENLITQEQLVGALDYQSKNGGRIGSCLVRLGHLSEDAVTAVLSKQYGVPCINLGYFEVDPDVAGLFSREVAERYQVLPLSRMGSTLTIAMVDPTNVIALDELKFITGLNVQPLVASESQVISAIKKHFVVSDENRLRQAFQDITESSNGASEVEVIPIGKPPAQPGPSVPM